MSNIGQTLGNLTTAQQGTLSNIGQTYGNLTADQQRILTGIGSSVGSLAAGDLDRDLTGASVAGNLSGNDFDRQLSAAGTAGNLSGNDFGRQLTAAGIGGDLATQAQTAGLQGAGALQAIGAQQENKTQQSLDLAYADFLRQQGYPQAQIDAMTKTFGGVQNGIPQYKETAGETKDVTTVGAGPSGLQSAVGTVGTLTELNKQLGNPLGSLFGGGSSTPNYNLIGNVSQPAGITPQATLNPVSGLRL